MSDKVNLYIYASTGSSKIHFEIGSLYSLKWKEGYHKDYVLWTEENREGNE